MPIMPPALTPNDDDENYERLLREQLNAPPVQQEQPLDIGQVGASLAQAANQMGAVGGRAADSSSLKNFADTLTRYKEQQNQNLLAQNQNRQSILAKLAMMKDTREQKDNLLAENMQQKQEQRAFEQQQQNRNFQQQKELLGLKGSQEKALADARLGAKSGAVNAEGEPVKLSVAQTAVDKNFAKDYNDYVAQGGFAEADKGLSKVRNVANELRKDDSLTGPMAGMTPDWVRSFTNPHAIDVRENLEDVVQRSMRQIMGAQFTEAEGRRLISRAYNPSLPASINAQRVEALANSLEKAAKAKTDAIKYYENYGTLAGYKGSTELPSIDAIAEDAGLNNPTPRTGKPTSDEAVADDMMSNPPIPRGPKVGDVRRGYQFVGGDPADKNNWKKVQ